MEQQVNPYEAGEAQQQGYVDPSASVSVTPVALNALMGTKFWVMLVGITMLIVTAIQLVMLFFINGNTGGFGSSAVTIMVAVQVLTLVIYTILAIRLLQYGKAIKRLIGSASNEDLERAMDVQTKFWRLLGLMCILMLVLMLVSAIGGVMMINSAASNFR